MKDLEYFYGNDVNLNKFKQKKEILGYELELLEKILKELINVNMYALDEDRIKDITFKIKRVKEDIEEIDKYVRK